jgi:phospholipase C
MGYYTAEQLPVYDNLAEQFCVCDRWFSSMPGPTIPNRLYALAGTSDGETDNPPAAVPFRSYDLKTIYDFLPPGMWKHFADDVSSLLYFKKYRKIKTMINVLSDNSKSFLQLAKKGKLPAFSWIDPNFASWPPGSKAGNDDHPPLNVRQGQKLVGQVYNALQQSPKWDKTLLVVTYDEHGGFYDHVIPPKNAKDKWAHMRKYGLRVPTLVISPWIGKRTVSHEIFDHSSILKTVLLRFCRRRDGGIPHMSKRVDAATPLSVLLTEKRARKDCKPAPQVPAWRGVAPASDSTDFQNLMRALRDAALSE